MPQVVYSNVFKVPKVKAFMCNGTWRLLEHNQ